MKITSEDVSREELESIAFNETFHRIRRDLIGSERNEEVVEALKWFDKVIMYNVPNGKKNRGMAVVMSYRRLATPSDLVNPDNLEAASESLDGVLSFFRHTT